MDVLLHADLIRLDRWVMKQATVSTTSDRASPRKPTESNEHRRTDQRPIKEQHGGQEASWDRFWKNSGNCCNICMLGEFSPTQVQVLLNTGLTGCKVHIADLSYPMIAGKNYEKHSACGYLSQDGDGVDDVCLSGVVQTVANPFL